MSDSNGPRKEQEEAYGTISGNLQNMALIFLGFLLFISYLLFPYYFIAESYKDSKNLLHFTNIINQNVLDVQGILKNYSSNYPGYKEDVKAITHKGDVYIVNISGVEKLYIIFYLILQLLKTIRRIKLKVGATLLTKLTHSAT